MSPDYLDVLTALDRGAILVNEEDGPKLMARSGHDAPVLRYIEKHVLEGLQEARLVVAHGRHYLGKVVYRMTPKAHLELEEAYWQ